MERVEPVPLGEDGMQREEWSRSRFWLCHFLQSRHERLRVDFSPPRPADPAADSELRRWLARDEFAPPIHEAGFLHGAAERYAADPAFVQAQRLMVKERLVHAQLIARLRERLGLANRPRTRRAWLIASAFGLAGPRFEMSIFLLADLIDLATLEQVQAETDDPAVRGVCGSIRRDRRGHVEFLTERLTMELADLNFARRNLRRARLRALFAAILANALYRRGALLRAAGASRRAFAAGAWREFDATLERVVPYRRDALVSALGLQREKPYEKPPL
jgi:hypothetical protein